MARHPQRDNDQYSDDEAQRRFVAAVKAGLNTKPKPLKSMTPKGVPAQSKKRRKRGDGMNPSENKSMISEHEAEELIKGLGRVATVVVHDDGLVTATAISANQSDTRIQNEVDGLLYDIQRKYRIVKKRR